METELEERKRFDEIVGKPIMTAHQKIEQMKREREELEKKTEQSAPLVQETPLKKKTFAFPLTFEKFRDYFRPVEIDIPRVRRTIHTREDVLKMEHRLLKILGGAGAKHGIGKERFRVSMSAFYNYLLLSFFEVHKEEIERLEKLLSE